MADNNTFVLFEEIKNKLETIYKEVKELKEKENSSASLPLSLFHLPQNLVTNNGNRNCSINMNSG
ncbi:hypothetical protein TFUB4_01648 [Tannerella forsythia]|nr:hypothetical protein TFUB4_01648 [Tannerella forsythia]